MKRNIAFIFYVIAFLGCARMHSGYYAVQVGKEIKGLKTKEKATTALGLVVSGQENTALASRYFGVLDFTFENTSQDWIRIKAVKVDFGDDKINQNIVFTSGRDIKIWHESIEKRNVIRDFNTETILSAIAGFGAGMALSSHNSDIQKIGTMAAIGSVTSLSAYEFNKFVDKIEKAEIFPQNHLLARGFIIPPGLSVKKWLLINSQNHAAIGYTTNLFLEYETEHGRKEKVKLDFRSMPNTGHCSSEWQNDLCTK
jgi:hypothetical protein